VLIPVRILDAAGIQRETLATISHHDANGFLVLLET
jgi:hypothetical protein